MPCAAKSLADRGIGKSEIENARFLNSDRNPKRQMDWFGSQFRFRIGNSGIVHFRIFRFPNCPVPGVPLSAQSSPIDHDGRGPYIRASMKRLFLIATFGVALVILIVLFTQIDVTAAFTQIQRVGFAGAAAILAEMTIALLGPLLAWHILMRADGIRIRFGTTLVSGLMGRAVNLVSPLMYFGGEGVRTLHIARVTETPNRRVLGTILGGEFQLLTALSASIVGALIDYLRKRNSSWFTDLVDAAGNAVARCSCWAHSVRSVAGSSCPCQIHRIPDPNGNIPETA